VHELRTSRRATYHMLIAIARGKCYVGDVEAYFRIGFDYVFIALCFQVTKASCVSCAKIYVHAHNVTLMPNTCNFCMLITTEF